MNSPPIQPEEKRSPDGEMVMVPREAAKVFADVADQYSDREDDDFQVLTDMDVLTPRLRLKHFRAIRAALASAPRPDAPKTISEEVVGRLQTWRENFLRTNNGKELHPASWGILANLLDEAVSLIRTLEQRIKHRETEIEYHVQTVARYHDAVRKRDNETTALTEARHADLGRLMEATGVVNDGQSAPTELFERCLSKISRPDADAKLAEIVANYRQLAIQRISVSYDEYGVTKLSVAMGVVQQALKEAADLILSITERAPATGIVTQIISSQLWTFCYDVATAFQHDKSHAGTEFFKRAKTLGILLETEAGDDVRAGLQSASAWRPHTPDECEQFCQRVTATGSGGEDANAKLANPLISATELQNMRIRQRRSPIKCGLCTVCELCAPSLITDEIERTDLLCSHVSMEKERDEARNQYNELASRIRALANAGARG